jgi:uncharacterized protein YfeS
MTDEAEYLPPSHPTFAAHFSDPIYDDTADDSTPFGSDEAADEVFEWMARGVGPDLTLQAMLIESFGDDTDISNLDFDDEPLGIIVIALGFLLLRVNGKLEPEGREAVLKALDWYKAYLGPDAVNLDKAKSDLESFPQ